MVRNRKVGVSQHKHVHTENNENENSQSGVVLTATRAFKILTLWKTSIGFVFLLFAIYIGILGYLETRVNTPFDINKIVQNSGLGVPDRYWGTYRPGVYMGLKSREPKSPVFGLMWYELTQTRHKGVRHWCQQEDDLATYGWLRHDGVTFGEQLIVDFPHNITTSFVKTLEGNSGGHWTARIEVKANNNAKTPFGLIWYAALDESLGPAAPESRLWYEKEAIMGYTPQLKNFRVNLLPYKGNIIHMSHSEAHAPGLHMLKEEFYSLLKTQKHERLGRLAVLKPDNDASSKDYEANFVPVQLIVETPFVLDVVYTTEDATSAPLKFEEYTKVLETKKREFDKEFENKFKLRERGYFGKDIGIARAAMSNMIGGIGYFYGAGRVQSAYTKEPVPYWRAPLYTAVPSRSFFPRGFLWDEGFHGLLIGRWNPEIQLDIAAHWLDLINIEGWIPREQILGPEALARVPKEFVVQHNAAANPPILILQVAHLVKTRPEMFKHGTPHRATLDRMFTRLQAWFQWFQFTQKGEEPTSYRWRGREDDPLQLNPKTLTSGMDDYPRASHPSTIERHVDLRCWMYATAHAMSTIAFTLERDTSKYDALRDQLGDEKLLNELHWSSKTNTYADYGLHTDDARLVRKQAKNPNEQSMVVRVVSVQPEPRLVTSAFGYISLFPMLLKVLNPESGKLGKILEDLDKPELLWSPYGLRSLSKTSPFYMKRNTEHDPPYWRGQIWINMNYLALAALKHYGNTIGPHAERARHLHDKLRNNVVQNILSEYKRTGYLWEQYSGEDGRGSGCKPFNGWTALVVLIMADEY